MDRSPMLSKIRTKKKGHAQRLRRAQRNPRSNAKIIGAQTTADGEFDFSESVKASNDRATPDCRSGIRTEFDRFGHGHVEWYQDSRCGYRPIRSKPNGSLAERSRSKKNSHRIRMPIRPCRVSQLPCQTNRLSAAK